VARKAMLLQKTTFIVFCMIRTAWEYSEFVAASRASVQSGGLLRGKCNGAVCFAAKARDSCEIQSLPSLAIAAKFSRCQALAVNDDSYGSHCEYQLPQPLRITATTPTTAAALKPE